MLCNPEHSIAYQRAECEKRLARCDPDSRIVAEFVDAGYGGNDYNRPALQKVLSTAINPNRQFDHIIVFAIDRISRSVGLLDTVEKVLAPTGVGIFVTIDSDR